MSNFKFIKCIRGCIETLYTTRSLRGEEVITQTDNEDIYLKLYGDDILNFRLTSSGQNIIAEVNPAVGKISLNRGKSDMVTASNPIPVIIISVADTDNIDAFGELVGMDDLSAIILKDITKD